MTNQPEHCESCGSTDREDLTTGDQGYTACCNEPVCYGSPSALYGTRETHVSACCWSKAHAAGIERGSKGRVPADLWTDAEEDALDARNAAVDAATLAKVRA